MVYRKGKKVSSINVECFEWVNFKYFLNIFLSSVCFYIFNLSFDLQVSSLHHVVSQATSEYCNVSAATESVPVAPVHHQNTPVRNVEEYTF